MNVNNSNSNPKQTISKVSSQNSIDTPVLNSFDQGKIIVSLSRECTYPRVAIQNEHFVFDELNLEKIETIFRPSHEDLEGEIGAIKLIYLVDKTMQSQIDTIRRLNQNPCVVLAEPDYILDLHNVPNDKYFPYLWGMRAVNAPNGWNFSVGSNNVLVAILDSGIDYLHPDIIDNLIISINSDQLDDVRLEQLLRLETAMSAQQKLNSMDNTGHGTHVAGTVGAVGNNFVGVCGVCWQIGLISIKIGNAFMDLGDAIKAINFANRNSIEIINASWGGWFYSEALEYAIEHYNGLFVASSGNSGSNNDLFPVFPASYECENIISVAATNRENMLAIFSNYGTASVDIAAPGVDILSTDIMSRYSYMDGTSMAAPHVAGAAALLKATNPALSSLEIKNILLSSVDKNFALDGKVLSSGTLNVANAIDLARRN